MKSAIKAVLMDVLPMADIQKLSVRQACERFVARATQFGRAFVEMGKLHFALGKTLPRGRTIYGELQKLGVSKSTISNASYASKVWEVLVQPAVVTEAVFDSFTFAKCRAICRVLGLSGSTKKTLKPEEVKVVITSCPKTWEEELESLADSGLTCAEREKAAKEAADEAAKQTAAKAASPAPAGAAPAAANTPATGTLATPASAPASGAPAAAPSAASAPAEKGKKTAASAPAAPTLSGVLELLDAVELGIAHLPQEEASKVVARIVALADELTRPAKADKPAKPAAKAAAKAPAAKAGK